MPLTVDPPSDEEAAAGMAARFEYRNDEHAATVRGTAKRGDGGITLASLEITADDGDITQRLLRGLHLGELLAKVRSATPPPPAAPQQVNEAATPCQCRCGQRKQGRASLTDAHLRQVALAYLEETAPDKGRQALRRIAERFERPEKTVHGWIARARREGWLGPGSKGRSGAEPGPRLLAEAREGTTV